MSFATHEMLRDEGRVVGSNAYNDNYGASFGAAQSTYSMTSPFAHTNMYGGGVLDYKQGVSFQAPPPGPTSVAAAPPADAFDSAPGGAVSVMPFHGGAEVTMKVVDVAAPAPSARAAASAEATDSKERPQQHTSHQQQQISSQEPEED